MAREQRYIDMKGDDEPEPDASEPTDEPVAARWGFMSGFCGADSMSFAARDLGGAPVAGFDVDETVQNLWSGRTGIPCCLLEREMALSRTCQETRSENSTCTRFRKRGTRRNAGVGDS